MVLSVYPISRPKESNLGNFLNFPVDMLVTIFQRVDFKDLCELQLLNKSFYWLIEERKKLIIKKIVEGKARQAAFQVDLEWRTFGFLANREELKKLSGELLGIFLSGEAHQVVLKELDTAFSSLSDRELLKLLDKLDISEEESALEVNPSESFRKFFKSMASLLNTGVKGSWIKGLVSNGKFLDACQTHWDLFFEIVWEAHSLLDIDQKELIPYLAPLANSLADEAMLERLDQKVKEKHLADKIETLAAFALLLAVIDKEACKNIFDKMLTLHLKFENLSSPFRFASGIYLGAVLLKIDREEGEEKLRQIWNERLAVEKNAAPSPASTQANVTYRARENPFLRKWTRELSSGGSVSQETMASLIGILKCMGQDYKIFLAIGGIFKKAGRKEEALKIILKAIPLVQKIEDHSKRFRGLLKLAEQL